MFKHKGNKRYLELVKVEDNRYYFIDINTGEEIDYAESTFKRYIEEIGTILEQEEGGLTNEEYVILRQGNYVPSWMLGGRNRINEIREYIETDGAGYHKGTYEVQDHELAATKNINKFKQLVKEFPQILEATSSKPIGVTKVGRDLAKQFILTGIVTLSTNGLYIKKGELKNVTTNN